MKTRNKLYDKSRLRLLCLLTALLGLFGAGQTWAGNPTTLTVGGTNVLSGGYWTTNTDGTLTADMASAENYNVKYDKDSNTLTLKDATINGTDTIYHVGAGIFASGDLTIVLEGSSTVKGVHDPNGESQSIRVEGNLTIQGGGSLTAQGAETSSGSSYGIFVIGSFTQQSGSVTASGGNINGNDTSTGLYVSDGTVTVQGGTLTATGGTTGSGSYGISMFSSVTVNDAIVTATGGTGKYSYGLHIQSSSPSVTLSDNGSLTARSESADRAGGIYVRNLLGSAGAVTVGDNSTLLANSVILYDNSFTEKPLAPTGNGSWLIYGQSNQPSAVGGTYTLTDNLTIESGNTLTIPAGSTLTIPEDKTLTADANQLVVNGELVLEGTFEKAKELEGTGAIVLGEITLTDDEGISAYEGYQLKLKSKKVTYVRALSDNSQYGTICLPFVPTSVAGGQVTYYQVEKLGSNEITLVETDFEAGKPLFYRTSGTGSITFSAESAAGVELVTIPATDNFMVGTMREVIPTTGYFLKKNNIYPIADGVQVKVKPFRAYVKGQNDASQANVMSVNVARP